MLKFAIILAALCYGGESAEFYLYKKDFRAGLHLPMDNLPGALWPQVDPTEDTIILIHGHGGNGRDDRFNSIITAEILATPPDYNVIVVDWKAQAKDNYATSFSNVRNVADDLVVFISHLVTLNVELKKMHLVGFNLGAHIAGIAGKNLNRPDNERVARITGLDPARNQWSNNPDRLSSGSADYVEAIHTDGSGISANGIGSDSGDVNFYANGGSNQPGCITSACSHIRAYELFAASVRNRLTGNACNSNAQLNLNSCRGASFQMGGIALPKMAPRDRRFRINTGRNWPYNM